MPINNEQLKNYAFLQDMYDDDYFPTFLVDKGKQILIRLCETIEAQKPADKESLLTLTHSATEEFNALDEELHEHDSEIETMAREAIAHNFAYIVKAYGFEVNIEDVIATRGW